MNSCEIVLFSIRSKVQFQFSLFVATWDFQLNPDLINHKIPFRTFLWRLVYLGLWNNLTLNPRDRARIKELSVEDVSSTSASSILVLKILKKNLRSLGSAVFAVARQIKWRELVLLNQLLLSRCLRCKSRKSAVKKQ